MIEGGKKKGLPDHAVQLIRTTDREAVRELVQLKDYVDLVIPRGGEALIKAVSEQAHVPVIKHYKGVCHTYIDASADLEMALAIVINAKCQRPGVCNAMETLLVHRDVAQEFLPQLATVAADKDVELRGDSAAREIVPEMVPADESDWYAEYLSLILAVKVVDSVEEAVEHINTYGSRHSDAIVAQSESAQKTFAQAVDSSAVYINASTRFTDGAEFGMGAEIGISTDKIHARGPMGLEELTTYKYVVYGKGQIRE
jgi:glutamate-5-semialdehyde dehydrogenase